MSNISSKRLDVVFRSKGETLASWSTVQGTRATSRCIFMLRESFPNYQRQIRYSANSFSAVLIPKKSSVLGNYAKISSAMSANSTNVSKRTPLNNVATDTAKKIAKATGGTAAAMVALSLPRLPQLHQGRPVHREPAAQRTTALSTLSTMLAAKIRMLRTAGTRTTLPIISTISSKPSNSKPLLVLLRLEPLAKSHPLHPRQEARRHLLMGAIIP